MGSFIAFKTMISSGIVIFVWIFGAIFLTGYSIYAMTGGTEYPAWYGIVALTLGNLAWRLVCEGIIVMFSIHDRLAAIEKNTAKHPE